MIYRKTLTLAITAIALVNPIAVAEVPSGPPTFTDPLSFTNPYSPFEEGAIKVFLGKSEGARIVVVDHYTSTTRTFMVGGNPVDARLMREVEFEDGELTEISYNYFATADDGTVYYFGEVVDNYEDGEVTDHDGSWLVGGPGAGDPPETLGTPDPAVFMPGNPEIGDEFKPEDIPPTIDETVVIQKFEKVKTPAGKYKGAMRVKEFHGDGETEKKWYAAGIGVVKAKSEDEVLSLASSTLAAIEP